LCNRINGIGHCYEYDIGIKRDLRRAAYLYKKAGNNVAQCNLAFMYLNGKETYVNYDKAFELFKQLAEVKYLDGIIMLGYCYKNGIGISINKKKHLNYTKKRQI
jgi:TPR repeat protein